MTGDSIEEFVSMSQMWKWRGILCAAGKDALGARCMQTVFVGFFTQFCQMQSALQELQLGIFCVIAVCFCHSRKLWLWQAHSTHQ